MGVTEDVLVEDLEAELSRFVLCRVCHDELVEVSGDGSTDAIVQCEKCAAKFKQTVDALNAKLRWQSWKAGDEISCAACGKHPVKLPRDSHRKYVCLDCCKAKRFAPAGCVQLREQYVPRWERWVLCRERYVPPRWERGLPRCEHGIYAPSGNPIYCPLCAGENLLLPAEWGIAGRLMKPETLLAFSRARRQDARLRSRSKRRHKIPAWLADPHKARKLISSYERNGSGDRWALCLCMFFLWGISVPTIARCTKVSTRSVEAMLWRLRRRGKRLFGDSIIWAPQHRPAVTKSTGDGPRDMEPRADAPDWVFDDDFLKYIGRHGARNWSRSSSSQLAVLFYRYGLTIDELRIKFFLPRNLVERRIARFSGIASLRYAGRDHRAVG